MQNSVRYIPPVNFDRHWTLKWCVLYDLKCYVVDGSCGVLGHFLPLWELASNYLTQHVLHFLIDIYLFQIALTLLQNNPSTFINQKLNSLPSDLQVIFYSSKGIALKKMVCSHSFLCILRLSYTAKITD